MIICDWEGCISSPGGGRIPWPTRDIFALCELIHRIRSLDGPPVVLCSGRQFPYGEAAIQAINAFWEDSPSILENGAGLYYPTTKKVRWHPNVKKIPKDKMAEIRQSACAYVKEIGGEREVGKEYCISLNPPQGKKVEWLAEQMRKEVLKDYLDVIEITHSKCAVDIAPKGINKGAGVEFLSQTTGIPLADMVGIGDSEGDLAMLSLVGHPTGPVNASERVRQIAEYISPFESTHGVIDIIRRYTRIL